MHFLPLFYVKRGEPGPRLEYRAIQDYCIIIIIIIDTQLSLVWHPARLYFSYKYFLLELGIGLGLAIARKQNYGILLLKIKIRKMSYS